MTRTLWARYPFLEEEKEKEKERGYAYHAMAPFMKLLIHIISTTHFKTDQRVNFKWRNLP